MNNVVIGAIGNYKFDQIKYWVNSLNRSGFKGKKILLSYNSNQELISQLKDNGIEVYDVKHDSFGRTVQEFPCHTGKVDANSTEWLVHHMRFFHMWQLIQELKKDNKIGYIIHTDVRDIVFQENPDTWLYEHSLMNDNRPIIAPSEYLTFKEENWNQELALTNYGGFIYDKIIKDSLVFNVGSFASPLDEFCNICLMTYMLTYRRNKLSDQPAHALLFNTILKDKVFVADTRSAWSMQFGTMHENFNKYKEQLRGEPARINSSGKVVNECGNPYVILHQYERVPEFKTLLESKYA
jgi:hypothetical protein